MSNQIFTTGYTGQNINELKPLVESLEAVLVDIRFSPYSQIMHWRQVYLKVLLGKKYLHLINLGNRTYKEMGKITIQNLQLGIKTLLALNTNAILFCACEKFENCHRRVVADELHKQGIETIEITDWKSTSLPFLPFNES
jgi:uncharacterized protein (DUF488 family)